MSDESDPGLVFARSLLEDAVTRVRFQHEFTLAGFRTLVLINGGAIIALLTYIGNVTGGGSAGQLRGAFISYVIGLAATTFAYMFAYFSQGLYMEVQLTRAVERLGLEEETDERSAKAQRVEDRGTLCIHLAVGLTVLGLAGFVIGSIFAMYALA